MAAADICMYYLRGACRFGNRCWNSHDWSSFMSVPTPSVSVNTDNDEEREPSTSNTNCESQQDEPSSSSTKSESQQDEPIISSAINESQQDEPSTSSTISESQQDEPSTSSTIIESQQDMTEEQQVIQTTDTTEEMDNKSSGNELLKSLKKNANKLKEIGKITEQVFCQKLLPNKEKTEWDEVIKNCVNENLQCSVCMEIFIKPTVLNCSHTFCETCIFLWMKKAKKCPMCRVNIKSKSLCLSLSTFIEKIVEFMPEEIKVRRSIAVKDRSKIKVEDNVRRSRNRSTRMDDILTGEGQSQHPLLDLFMATSGNHDSDDDIEEHLVRDQSEVMRMNLHDIVLSSGGLNPLLDYHVWCE